MQGQLVHVACINQVACIDQGLLVHVAVARMLQAEFV